MKKLTIYLLTSLVVLLQLTSCQTDEPEKNPDIDYKESVALRIALNNIKEHNSKRASMLMKETMCFNFVYPIQLIYNNRSMAEVENLDGLLSILKKETTNLYIVGIDMPFAVKLSDDSILTISSEEEFFNLIKDCDIDLPVQNDFFDSCFYLIYPIQVITLNGTVYTINSDVEFESFLSENFDDWYFEFVYPLTVTLSDGAEVILESDYDFFDILNECFTCGCDQTYDPVCVNIDGDMVEFYNPCEAECAGFTSDDFVNCEYTNNSNSL